MAQQDIDLTDDLIIQLPGDTAPVLAGPGLRATGWRGGQWVHYVPPTGVDDFVVEASDGNMAAGVMIFPSEAYNPGEEFGAVNNFTGSQLRTDQGSIAGASTVTIMNGGGRYLYWIFESIALTAGGVRAGGPATFTLNENIYVSENGFPCNDSAANLAAAGIANPILIGICSAVPAERNNWRLGLDMKY